MVDTWHYRLMNVSKELKAATVDVMHAGAPVEVLSAAELRQLKIAAGELDLVSEGLGFGIAVDQKWGHVQMGIRQWGYDYEMDDVVESDIGLSEALEALFEEYGGRKSFIEMVTTEYRRLLVVKTVELLAIQRLGSTPSPDLKRWSTRSRPTLLPDMMWHCHLKTSW